MCITVRPLSTSKEMRQFVKFRIDLYRDSPHAVPPLYMDELTTLDPQKNPAHEFTEARCFMAFDDDRPVGRICAMVNHRANEVWNTRSGRFGFVDFVDDEEVSRALFTAAEDWVKSRGMNSIHGPLGFTDLDQEGMLVDGFDQPGTMATIYNYPYYPEHIERLGFRKDAEWVEYLIRIPDTAPSRMKRVAEMVLKRHKLRIVKYKSASKLIKDGYVQKLFELVNDSYSHLYGFTPLTQAQIDYYSRLYIPMLNLDFLVLVVDEAGELVGMGVTMPSLSRALRKAQGKLFPFGILHLLKALKRKNPVIDCLLVAVRKDYQNKGVNALVFYDIIPHLKRFGAIYAESNPELVTNTKVQSQWDEFEHVNHKRRRAYVKELAAVS
jgi:GNAT superfamily N-acetyltransferase